MKSILLAIVLLSGLAQAQLVKCWSPVPLKLTASPANIFWCGQTSQGEIVFSVTLNGDRVMLDYLPSVSTHHAAGEPSTPGNIAWAFGDNHQRFRVKVVKKTGQGQTLAVWVRMVGWFIP